MNKEQIKEEVGELNLVVTEFEADGMCYMDRAVSVTQVYDLIDQLEEPEKVVIPRFVADWIESVRNLSNSMSCLMTYDQIKRSSHELTLWCYETGNNDNLHKLARAWLDGYEIEKEPLYVVEDNRYCLLCKFDGMVISTHLSESDEIPLEHLDFELTEKEIKDFDKRYWSFAQPVEETL